MKSTVLLVTAFVVVQLVGEPASAAYQLEPISRVFSPSGSKATQSFEVVNGGTERVALMISFATLERDELYVETNRDAEDEFLAYPAQMIVAPGGRQTVRVTWLGTPNPARELTYRIIVTQVPLERLDQSAVAEEPAKGQMRITVSYRGTLFIRPPKAAPRIGVAAAEPATAADGSRALAIVLDNSGTAVGLVKHCTVRLARAGGPPVTLPPAALVAVQNTRILGGGRRRYVVPWPADMKPGPVTATGQCAVGS
jgi:fimbrial chaperone protein